MKQSLLVMAVLWCTAAYAAAVLPKQPNILIVINDDLSWLECSAYGNSSILTPQFDRVARAGVLFTHGYCSSEELYDCVADPDQLKNLAADPAFAEVKAKLRARLEAYQRQTQDPRITGEMSVFSETLKFVQSRKSAGYSDGETNGTKTPKKKTELN